MRTRSEWFLGGDGCSGRGGSLDLQSDLISTDETDHMYPRAYHHHPVGGQFQHHPEFEMCRPALFDPTAMPPFPSNIFGTSIQTNTYPPHSPGCPTTRVCVHSSSIIVEEQMVSDDDNVDDDVGAALESFTNSPPLHASLDRNNNHIHNCCIASFPLTDGYALLNRHKKPKTHRHQDFNDIKPSNTHVDTFNSNNAGFKSANGHTNGAVNNRVHRRSSNRDDSKIMVLFKILDFIF